MSDSLPESISVLKPLEHPTLSTARAARLLETAMTTPDYGLGAWQTTLWRPPTVEVLKSWVLDYEVEQRVARGSSGWVYVARHRLLDRRVALKVLAPAAQGPEAGTAALRASEGRLIARLSHRNVLPVYDSKPLPDGQHLFVFQYARGGSLRQRLAPGPLLRRTALLLAADLAAGLAHAHEGGIIHRDLKPENILFDELGTPMIGDFGSAVEPRLEEVPHQYCGTTGTPLYRAPEQASGGALSPAVDIYALGIILHEMLTGTVPSSPGPGKAARISPLPGLDQRVRQLLTGMLQEDPRQREPDAATLALQLRKMALAPVRLKWAGLAAVAALALGIAAKSVQSRDEGQESSIPAQGQAAVAPLEVAPLVRLDVLKVLTDFRATENNGKWEEGNAFHADYVDYFNDGAITYQVLTQKRQAFGASHAYFRTLFTSPVKFAGLEKQEVKTGSTYWAVSEKVKGGFSLGTLMDDIIFRPREDPPGWEIVSHQNGGSDEMWFCSPGRTLDESGATAFIDRFIKVEASGDLEAQLAFFAPRCFYYSNGWVGRGEIRMEMETRNTKRPGFYCERKGPVSVQAGSHQRWKLEFPMIAYPPPPVWKGPNVVRPRKFLVAPQGESNWLIIGEASQLTGWEKLEQFWQDGQEYK